MRSRFFNSPGTIRNYVFIYTRKPNRTEQNEVNEASAVGDDETPWPGQKSRRVVYRYYRVAGGSGSAPLPRRNASE
ncbi:hypothetical protein G5I_08859 [Acromyrmex echinatior]|uniref:Uncharacterized protein n=1 Tax=Acromyrmex echinatior TaxID=103372 RepID=F4WSM6_ACREC|nr:hypothetical protein G5I_08859 [Acromyrmex echinatior]